MKLYLSSYRVPVVEALFELLPVAAGKVRMALIPNAADYYAKLAWEYKIKDYIKYMGHLGFKPEVVDLRDYEQASLQKKLQGYDLIWVCGGNTFNLRYELRRSGFEKIIKKLMEGGMVYSGDSAGALVAGPSLKGVELADQPAFAPKTIFAGLKLVPNVVIPHADNPGYQEPIKKLIALHESDPNTIVLNDNQAVVIDGKSTKVITGKGIE